MVVERTEEQIKNDNDVRLRRAEAWRNRAEQVDKTGKGDSAVRFVFWWIAFEALYKKRTEQTPGEMYGFVCNIIKKGDRNFVGKTLYANRKTGKEIVRLPQTHDGCWVNRLKDTEPNGEERRAYKDKKDWAKTFEREKYSNEPLKGLEILFNRLRVVRNQIFHGANSQNDSQGLIQTEKGAELLGVFVPYFIKVVKENPEFDWGEVPFPNNKGIPAWE